MSIVINLLVFIAVLAVIVGFHEFGHFLLAKLNGVYVYEFAIGMGPKLFGWKKGETDYSVRAIPIGGYCQLAGEDVDDDDLKKVPLVIKGEAKEWLESRGFNTKIYSRRKEF